MSDYISQQNRAQIVACIRYSGLAGSEEIKDRIQKEQGDDGKYHSNDDVERNYISKDLLGRELVFLSQLD